MALVVAILLLVLTLYVYRGNGQLSAVLHEEDKLVDVDTPLDAKLSRGDWSIFLVLRTDVHEIQAKRHEINDAARKLNDWIKHIPCGQIFVYTGYVSGRPVETLSTPCHDLWKDSLRMQLESLFEEEYYPYHEPKRTKRGLVDGIGQATKWLFGMATTHDINEIKGLIGQSRMENNRVRHNVNALATIVDHALHEINNTKNDLRHTLKVLSHVQKLQRATITAQNVLGEIARASYYTTALVNLDTHLRMAQNNHRDMMQDVFQNRLTETLLPQAVYGNISTITHNLGYAIPEYEWIRRFASLDFVSQEQGQIIVKAIIPLLENEEYLLYGMTPIPSIVNDSVVSLQITPRILYDTVGRRMAAPRTCIGYGPVICDPVPIWEREGHTCEAGIITTHVPSITLCKAEVRDLPEAAEFYTNNGQERLLLPQTETLSLACAGQREDRRTFDMGTYVMQIPSTCVLAGDGWTVKGTKMGSKRFVIHNDNEYIDLDLSRWMFKNDDTYDLLETESPYDIDAIVAEMSSHAENIQILDDSVKNIIEHTKDSNDNNVSFSDGQYNHMDYFEWTILSIVLLIIIILCILAFRHRKNLKFLFGTCCNVRKTDTTKVKNDLKTTKIEINDTYSEPNTVREEIA